MALLVIMFSVLSEKDALIELKMPTSARSVWKKYKIKLFDVFISQVQEQIDCKCFET